MSLAGCKDDAPASPAAAPSSASTPPKTAAVSPAAPAAKPTASPKPTPSTADSHRKLVNAFAAAMASGDMAAFAPLLPTEADFVEAFSTSTQPVPAELPVVIKKLRARINKRIEATLTESNEAGIDWRLLKLGELAAVDRDDKGVPLVTVTAPFSAPDSEHTHEVILRTVNLKRGLVLAQAPSFKLGGESPFAMMNDIVALMEKNIHDVDKAGAAVEAYILANQGRLAAMKAKVANIEANKEAYAAELTGLTERMRKVAKANPKIVTDDRIRNALSQFKP